MLSFRRTIGTLFVSALLASTTVVGAVAEDMKTVKIDVIGQVATGAQVKDSGGTGVVRVTQGDKLEIHWTSDQATELHLHGYNVTTKVDPGDDAIMSINARAAGRFAIESHGFGADHHAEKTLLYLEVLPR